MFRVSSGNPGGVSVMLGSGGRGGLPSKGVNPAPATKLFLLSTRSTVSTSLHTPPCAWGPRPPTRVPFRHPVPWKPVCTPLFSCKPSHAYLLLGACRVLLPPSFAPLVPDATPAGSHSAPARLQRGSELRGPLPPTVPNLWCPGKRWLKLQGLPWS